MALRYQRILLKISGEALGGAAGTGFDAAALDAICGGVKKAHALGAEIGIVVGGGNFWRGRTCGDMERTLADKIGMLATVMNCLAVSDALNRQGVPTKVMTSIVMPQVAEPFTREGALARRWPRAAWCCSAAAREIRSSPPIRPARCAPWRSART
jgi:uridylate kinase